MPNTETNNLAMGQSEKQAQPSSGSENNEKENSVNSNEILKNEQTSDNNANQTSSSSNQNTYTETPSKKDHTVIWILLIICAVVIAIKAYTSYLNNQTEELAMKYLQEQYNNKTNDKPLKPITLEVPKYPNATKPQFKEVSEEDEVFQELKEMTDEYNKELPEGEEDGITLLSCKIEGKSLLYTVEWDGMSPSDFNTEVIAELKKNCIEAAHEEGVNSNSSKYLFSLMRKGGYNIAYKYINESGEKLCVIKIRPSEL